MSNATAAPEPSKPCTKCGEVKSLDEFSYDKRHADGRQSQCRKCTKARQKKYTQENRERYLELRRQEYERHKGEILAAQAAYREVNRDRINRKARERIAALTGDELEALREKQRARSRAYRLQNPEVCAERIRAWQQANPAKASAAVNRRRARKHGNGEPEEFSRDEIGERDAWICGICTRPIDQALRWPNQQSASLDHVVPLAHGGEHTRANSRIAHWICNVRRGADRKRATFPPVAEDVA